MKHWHLLGVGHLRMWRGLVEAPLRHTLFYLDSEEPRFTYAAAMHTMTKGTWAIFYNLRWDYCLYSSRLLIIIFS